MPPRALTDFQAVWTKQGFPKLTAEASAIRANEVFAVLRLMLEAPVSPVVERIANDVPSAMKDGEAEVD